jgi:hypothetical protein
MRKERFKGYKMAQDADFCKVVKVFKQEKNAHGKGADSTAPALMEIAENKYNTCFLIGQ